MTVNVETVKASIDTLTNTTTTALTAIQAEIKTERERSDRIEAVLKRPGFISNETDPVAALKTEREAVAVFARSGDDSKLKEIQAGMSTSSDPDGGYLSMPTYSTSITRKLFDQSPIRRLARTETITSGDSFVEPIDNGEVEGV